jgi:hypothetical protein
MTFPHLLRVRCHIRIVSRACPDKNHEKHKRQSFFRILFVGRRIVLFGAVVGGRIFFRPSFFFLRTNVAVTVPVSIRTLADLRRLVRIPFFRRFQTSTQKHTIDTLLLFLTLLSTLQVTLNSLLKKKNERKCPLLNPFE